MDKYEYKVKLEQIEKLAAKKDYVTAAKIADSIDWRKVKSVTTLTMIADIYEATDRLEDCYEILNMVYDRSPIGRRVIYRLAQVATKMHDFEEAIELYKEFIRIAPHDLNKYILKYQIYRERGSSVEDQIVILEEYKGHEYDEKWAYELACLYEEAGQIDRCIEECDELILWFSEGEYVVKAMELKMKYQELTASQQEKYEHRFEYLEEAEPENCLDEEDTPEEVTEPEKMAEPGEVTEPAGVMHVEAVLEESVEEESSEEDQPAETESVAETTSAVEEPTEESETEPDDTPQVSVINTNKFSTINLQEELAKELQMFFTEEELTSKPEEDEKEDTQEFVPVKKEAVTVVVEPVKEVTEEAVAEVTEEVVAEPIEEVTEEVVAEPIEEVAEEVAVEPAEEVAEEAEKATVELKKEKLSETAELQSEILKYVTAEQEQGMETLFHTEEDGQMSLAIDEEKQITGQMTIGEILAAWEEKKRQMRAQIESAEVKKQAVPFETGEITSLLQDFIPKTPKDVQEIIEVVETETSAAETVTESVETSAEEPKVPAEEPKVPQEESEVPEEEAILEDDLPMDIDLADALEAALEEPQKKEEEDSQEETVGENTASMLDAIERVLTLEPAGKNLTEEQEKIFAYFTEVKDMKKQLIKLLNEEQAYIGKTDSREGNLIITGHPGNGKTTLAIDIVKAFQKQRREKGGKLAKITGDKLNTKIPAEVIRKLGGGALIIERAGSLNDDTVERLSEAMEETTGGLLVILEDKSEDIDALLKKNAGFKMKFNRSVDIPIFSNDELVAFGKSYAEEKEYFFDEMAVLALYDSIGVRQTADHVVNITEVKEFVDDAIAHAEKKSKGFFAKLSKKRIDEYGNKLLLEEDFDY